MTTVAHYRIRDQKIQTVEEHLNGVSSICKQLTSKIDLPEAGELLGLLHDLGKYSDDFQKYIKTATGIIDPDIDDPDVADLKGKIDHSTAGAQWIWNRFKKYGPKGKLIGQILAVCLSSHHGGMIDCLDTEGENIFQKRIKKDDKLTHLQTSLKKADQEIIQAVENIATDDFLKEMFKKVKDVFPQKETQKEIEPNSSNCDCKPDLKYFQLGFLTRFLFSCLIDADRIDSADFEYPENNKFRTKNKVNWQQAIDRLEEKLSSFKVRNNVDVLRNKISKRCLDYADKDQGLYSLTVPTGGGKTFASMRYALHHAKKHNLDHIIYIIPYTSIIDQNAREIRNILEKKGDKTPWVLEHHSNLEPEKQTWQSKLTSENWDAPIIFSTTVQFLEALFGGGTRGPRRMHNLAKSVVIFDEIQCIPINCIHLFCNGINFLTKYTKTTAVMCTATQPVFDKVNKDLGALNIPKDNELAGDTTELFKQLKRVNIVDKTRLGGWNKEKIADFVVDQVKKKNNCLVIVNTKDWAKQLYNLCYNRYMETNGDGNIVYHLSTSLCPAHRMKMLDEIRKRLDEKLPILCISTQLIEAGVDVDFNSVVRFTAGLDSVAQAAGRCNRNGNNETSDVYIINPDKEHIGLLQDIKIGKEKTERVLKEKDHKDFLSPMSMDRYFSYYFHELAEQMSYPLTKKQLVTEDTLLNLLSDNPNNNGSVLNSRLLQQSFKTAGRLFKSIDTPTTSLIVPYEKGKDIIADLCASYDPAKIRVLLKKAQKYSVNLFPNVWDKLIKANAINPIKEGEEIYYLDSQYYSDKFGVSTEIVNDTETIII